MPGNICFDFFFSSFNHNIYILIVTRVFKQHLGSKKKIAKGCSGIIYSNAG